MLSPMLNANADPALHQLTVIMHPVLMVCEESGVGGMCLPMEAAQEAGWETVFPLSCGTGAGGWPHRLACTMHAYSRTATRRYDV